MSFPVPTLLIVDDDQSNLESLQRIFQRPSARPGPPPGRPTSRSSPRPTARRRSSSCASSASACCSPISMMPGMTGMDLLKAAQTIAPETEVVLMTAYGTVETAVEAMKEGAYDFVTKPLKRAHVVRVGAARRSRSSRWSPRTARCKAQLGRAAAPRASIGHVAARGGAPWTSCMQAAPSRGDRAAAGRERHRQGAARARASTSNSPRATGPFVAGQLRRASPRRILEAELFGYEKGAFTGAVAAPRRAASSAADGGTLFLDEIGEIPRHVQVKLLRVLQEGEIERLGGSAAASKVDMRLVAATNQDLRARSREGRFREDLYYRLNVIAVHVPPLRDRRDDIPLLAEHFLQRLRREERQGDRAAARARALDALVRLRLAGQRARAGERDRARGGAVAAAT